MNLRSRQLGEDTDKIARTRIHRFILAVEKAGKTGKKILLLRKLYHYFMTIPKFMTAQVRFQCVTVSKMNELRANLKAKPLIRTFATYERFLANLKQPDGATDVQVGDRIDINPCLPAGQRIASQDIELDATELRWVQTNEDGTSTWYWHGPRGAPRETA